MPESRLRIGEIVGTHGVRGELNVLPLTDDPGRYSKLKEVDILTVSGEVLLHVRIEKVKYFKNRVIVKLEGISDMDSALKLKSSFLAVDRAHAVRLPENSYFICDLIGCSVLEEDGGLLGILGDILQTGANDIYAVRREGKKDLLIPAIKTVIRDVSVGERRIVVRLPEGLLDLYS